MRGRAAAEMMAADDAGKALALRHPDDVHVVLDLERVAEDLVAGLQRVARIEADFGERPHRRDPRLFEAALGGAVGPAVRARFDEADLDRLVAVLVRGLRLHDEARPGLQDRAR